MKKYALVIGASLLVGSLGWGAYEYQEGKDTEKKVEQYESYLSSTVTRDTAQLFTDANMVSGSIDNAIKDKKFEPQELSILVGQLYELMDLTQQAEKLAVSLDVFESKESTYQSANLMYSMGIYLSNIEPSKTLTDTQIEKLSTIQSFTTAWKDISLAEIPELKNEEGLETYFAKYERTMVTDKAWQKMINQMDKKTESILKEKKITDMSVYFTE